MARTPLVGENTVLAQMRRFGAEYARDVAVAGLPWRYYRLGAGPAVLWLTGGLRRAALGFGFLELLARRYTVIAPDYPTLRTFGQADDGLCGILETEGMARVHLVGQSYGGVLAQAFLARHPDAVDRLVLSSSGPADFGRAWLPVEYLAIALLRVLPERGVKRILGAGLARAISTVPEQREEWLAAVREILEHELTRADVVSHFAVAADIIRHRVVHPAAYAGWGGRAVALSARNDPTQRGTDRARYERLFGRPVQVVSMGRYGHTAALLDPSRYTEWLEQALS